jgi:hypothetical protein
MKAGSSNGKALGRLSAHSSPFPSFIHSYLRIRFVYFCWFGSVYNSKRRCEVAFPFLLRLFKIKTFPALDSLLFVYLFKALAVQTFAFFFRFSLRKYFLPRLGDFFTFFCFTSLCLLLYRWRLRTLCCHYFCTELKVEDEEVECAFTMAQIFKKLVSFSHTK